MSDPRRRMAIRNRMNQYQGMRFQAYIRTKLRRRGFEVASVNEYDGYSHGVDFVLKGTPWGLVPIQCKRSKHHGAGFRGLREVRRNSPVDKYPLVACFHRYYREGDQGYLHILVHRVPTPFNGFELLTLTEFVALVKDQARALTARMGTNTLSP